MGGKEGGKGHWILKFCVFLQLHLRKERGGGEEREGANKNSNFSF